MVFSGMTGLWMNQTRKMALWDYSPPECLNLRILRMELSCGETNEKEGRRVKRLKMKRKKMEKLKKWKFETDILLSKTGRRGKGVKEGMRTLPHLFIESTQSLAFLVTSRTWTLQYIKQLVKNTYSFFLQRLETFWVGRAFGDHLI